ncbi:MAG TPA: TIGR03808 family TAT-translocated repetitive protein [Methyloceanibacter sp.]|jgi:uncharacterized secreted repeat protein (TIGR03808 family)|nr:TIGR03808 family TAT-translocated repetitive protein [Methyloceanibacter sp.]
MQIGRRQVVLAGVGLGLAAMAGPRLLAARESEPQAFSTYGIVPAGGELDQTATLQVAADAAAQSGTPLFLPAGIYSTNRLDLKSGTHIHGVPGRTILRYRGGGTLLSLKGASNVRLAGLVLEDGGNALDEDGALLAAHDAKQLEIADCRVLGSGENGITLRQVSGRVRDCEFANIRKGALFSEDATGLQIAHNHLHDCGDNGILVWRSDAGEDGTIVTGNRVERIEAKSDGTGQNGNGINVYRAGSVQVSGNRISDCAFTAIRANAASNCQMIGNSCARLGEVALYADFAFQGAVIANNLVDRSAVGISVTNFNEGGRLAVVQGNLIRNIFIRKDVDSRGIGIAVEADSVVSGNVIEAVPTFGILLGWSPYLRDVNVTDNVIRNAHIGIAVSVDPAAGTALITDNLIVGSKDGAIRGLSGPTPVGPDLARESAEAYRNLAVYANVAR